MFVRARCKCSSDDNHAQAVLWLQLRRFKRAKLWLQFQLQFVTKKALASWSHDIDISSSGRVPAGVGGGLVHSHVGRYGCVRLTVRNFMNAMEGVKIRPQTRGVSKSSNKLRIALFLACHLSFLILVCENREIGHITTAIL